MLAKKVETKIGQLTFSLETGKIGKQADGAVMVRYGDTVVFVAAVTGSPIATQDFFPLRVDYREMTYAAGKFPGGFWKREGRPTLKEILTSRLMDRPIRPLFPDGFFDDVVITAIVMSADKENDPDVLSMVGASAALVLSPTIPFFGPTGAVRVGKVNGQFKVNPTSLEMDESPLNLIVAGTKDSITMIEGQTQELSEEEILQAVVFAKPFIADLCRIQVELAAMMGIPKKEHPATPEIPFLKELDARYFEQILEAHQVRGKFKRFNALDEVKSAALAEIEQLNDPEGPSEDEVRAAFDAMENKACRTLVLKGQREDGRGLTDVRNVDCEVSLLPRVHGSALFTRGETQALVTCTLGSSSDEQRVDGLEDEYRKKFMLDYNFPPFSVHEAKAPRSPSRREIGHGNLAERGLQPMLPPVEKFPYTIRLVSEIMESNGSSSMASVCGGTLALMDAGVPLIRPVAGVAMGLVKVGNEVRILTDIVGSEDHYGDMDLKIAGTEQGVTAIQMDLKVFGIDEDTLMKAFVQARAGRKAILARMLSALDRPRAEISQHAPRLLLIKINPEKIGAVIGPGGRIIKKIQEETGATIDIQDDGTVNVSSVSAEGAEKAMAIIRGITEEPEVGKTYTGRVTGVKEFGAFVEILPGRDGLVHISELSDGYIKSVDDAVKLGDVLTVKLLSVDDQGKIRLSRKAILREEKEKQAKPQQ